MNTNKTPPDITEVRVCVDQFLRELIAENVQRADTWSRRYGDMWRHIDSLAMAGGKRLRPYITTLTLGAYGGDVASRDAMRAATATELLHVALLIHDDIIDRDTKRRGVKNMTGRYLDTYRDYIADVDDRRHFANSAAMLSGDLLIAESYRLLGEIEHVDVTQKNTAMNHFSKAIFAVCGGELLDTEQSFWPSDVDAISIADYKTASYSFIGPLTIGAALAGATESECALLRDLGRAIGIAFQLQDDLLGVFGDAVATGKTTIGDIREGKRTYMVEQFYMLAGADDRTQFEELFGVDGLSDDDYRVATTMLETSGARQQCEQMIKERCRYAKGIVDKLAINRAYKEAFIALIDMSAMRGV